jgi:uncharacterized protein YgbK (DUF1537 family)
MTFSLIVADDFSGAADAAARAWPGSAALLEPSLEVVDSAVVALSTETRHAAGREARERIRELRGIFAGRALYKKIDSTLRGPWVEEVEELLEVTDYRQALVCPAFPEQGRTVREGWLWVHGERVQRIECPFEVRDAWTEEDLARIAAEVCSSILPVGSAGLARHVFRAEARPGPLGAGPGVWIVLVGSEHPVSQAQLAVLREARLPEVRINPEAEEGAAAGVFATGGETAARFLRRHGAQGIRELRELLPGIPAGRILGGRYNGTLMVLKAGGFGAPDTILRAIQLCSHASESR